MIALRLRKIGFNEMKGDYLKCLCKRVHDPSFDGANTIIFGLKKNK